MKMKFIVSSQSIAYIKELYDLERINRLEFGYKEAGISLEKCHNLIRSILKGYPIGIVTIIRKILDKGYTEYKIIDGSIRLAIIIDFLRGKLKVDGQIFEELDKQTKKDFYGYHVTFQYLEGLDDIDEKFKDDGELTDAGFIRTNTFLSFYEWR